MFSKHRRKTLWEAAGRIEAYFETSPKGTVVHDKLLIFSESDAASPVKALQQQWGIAKLPEPGAVRQRVKESTSGGKIHWGKLFGDSTGRREVKLEICSGSGDWVVGQAAADAGSADWCAMEIRRDRIFHGLCSAAMAGVGNLAFLCGDALAILRDRVPPGSVSRIVVSHPEPPQQQNKSLESQAAHLLMAPFF